MAKFWTVKSDVVRLELLINARDMHAPSVREGADRLLARVKSLLLVFFVSACAAALPQVSFGQVGVWLQSPKPGPNPNQVLVYATAISASAIAGWVIYVDDLPAYQTTSSSTALSQTVPLSDGAHLLYVRAWSNETFGTSVTLLIQVGPEAPTSLPLPTPPGNATVFTQMQNTSDDWTSCSLCAFGTHNTTNFWMAPFQHTPSKSGSSREFYVDGLPWTNALFIKTISGTSSVTNFLWDFWVYLDSTSAANIWSAEFDLWQFLGGTEFMIGSQCAFGDGYWETWDSANNRWIVDGIPCPRWAPNTWHHIQWYAERISPTEYRYDTLVVDGASYGVNQVWNVNPTPWPDGIGVQWQLDQGEKGIPLHEWIDNVQLTLW
jgi:hypothetical protein